MVESDELAYRMTRDTLAKMVFTQNADLLRELVAELLGLDAGSIGEFVVTNPDIPPQELEKKFCQLDISMRVGGQLVDLEIQVNDRHDFPQRTLYYWAREYSSALEAGGEYAALPRTVVVSIMDFALFGCAGFHSEFAALEVSRHELLSDRLSLHYFELPKVPELLPRPAGWRPAGRDERLLLWLWLFRAHTEREMAAIEGSGVAVMERAVQAYRQVVVSPRFREIERMRDKARHDEAQALYAARVEAEARGEARGKAESVLDTLEDRNIEVGKADRERILDCADAPTLRKWLRRSWQVADIGSLFDDDTAAAPAAPEEPDTGSGSSH